MTKILLATLFALALSPVLLAAEPPAEPFDKLRIKARDMGETPEGKAYENRFGAPLAGQMQRVV